MSLRSLVDCLAVVFLQAEPWVNSCVGKCETLAVTVLSLQAAARGHAGSTNPPELCRGHRGEPLSWGHLFGLRGVLFVAQSLCWNKLPR